MQIITSAIISLLFPVWIYAQTVKVIDEVTLQPIEKVLIFNDNHEVFTNSRGEADISSFNKSDLLHFQHPSYQNHKVTYEELEKSGFKVKLVERFINLKIVVKATNRWEQKKSETPNKISVITDREVEFQNPQTTADLLNLSNDVFIQKSQLGGGSPLIRGFATNRVLLVVDGVRMNNAILRSGNVQNVISLNANCMEHAEVISGPGSVIHGSDAIGGVMDFHSSKPILSIDDKLFFTSNAVSRYSSANNEKTGYLDFNIGTDKWGFLTSVTFSDYDDLRMGSVGNDDYKRIEYVERTNGEDIVVTNKNHNLQKFSGYSQHYVMQKIRFVPNDAWEFDYGFHYSKTSDMPRYDRLIETANGKLRSADWFYGPQKWVMNNLNVKYNKNTKLFDEAKIALAYQKYEESRNDRKFGDEQLRTRVETVGAFSVNLDFYKSLGEMNTLFYGTEVVTNSIGSTAKSTNIETGEAKPIATRYPDGSEWYSYAAYLNYKSNLSEQLTFVAGGRYNQVTLNATFDKTFYPFPFDEININTGAFNGNIGLVYRPEDTWQINLNASTGFRAPNIDDVGKVFDSEPGSVVVPNDKLSSEYAWNLDLGITKSIADKAQIEATGFYTLLQNAMVRRDFQFNGQDYIMYDGELSRVQAIQNADEAIVYGVQLALYTDISSNLSSRTNVNYAHGETQAGESLQHVPPMFGSIHFIYRTMKFRADLYADFNGEISYENLAPSERGKPHIYAKDANGNPYSPGWTTLNLKASYQLNNFVQINAGLENIFDKRYRPYSSGISAPGRNLIVGLRYAF